MYFLIRSALHLTLQKAVPPFLIFCMQTHKYHYAPSYYKSCIYLCVRSTQFIHTHVAATIELILSELIEIS